MCNFRCVFERFSGRFETFSDRFGTFSHHFLRIFGIVVVVVAATLFSASTQNIFNPKTEKKLEKYFDYFDTLILHVGVVAKLGKKEHPTLPLFVYGHSMGSCVGLY